MLGLTFALKAFGMKIALIFLVFIENNFRNLEGFYMLVYKKSISISTLSLFSLALSSCGLMSYSNPSASIQNKPASPQNYPSGQGNKTPSAPRTFTYKNSTNDTDNFLTFVDQEYSILPNGGKAPYYLVSPIQLPGNVNFDEKTGLISGKPAPINEGLNKIIVKDSTGATASFTIALAETCPNLSGLTHVPDGWKIIEQTVSGKTTESTMPAAPAILTFTNVLIVSSKIHDFSFPHDRLRCGYHDSSITSTPGSMDFIIESTSNSNYATLDTDYAWETTIMGNASASVCPKPENILGTIQLTDCPFYIL